MTDTNSLSFQSCIMRDTNFTPLDRLVHPSKLHRFPTIAFAPCVQHTPPFMTKLLHPSQLHRFPTIAFAPCIQHTPPFMTKLLHPSILHRLRVTFAPCVIHTPPLTTPLVHPLWLHRLTSLLAPCVTQTPPFWIYFAPSPSITTIQQLSLGITHAFSTLIINSFKKLVHSQTSPAFDHYDFLLPRDQTH